MSKKIAIKAGPASTPAVVKRSGADDFSRKTLIAQGLGYLASGVPFFVAPQYIVDQCWGSKGTPFQAVTMRFLGLSYTTLGGAVLLGATDDCGPKTRRNMHKVLLASGVANYFVCAEGKKRGGDAKIFDGIIGSSVLLGAASAVAAFRKD